MMVYEGKRAGRFLPWIGSYVHGGVWHKLRTDKGEANIRHEAGIAGLCCAIVYPIDKA